MLAPPPPPAVKSPLGEREFVLLMALLMALQALAIDAMLPALGTLSGELGVTDPNHRQLVVGIFLLASGIASLFPGMLADRFGRRPVLLCCLGAYVVTTTACALVTSFPALLALRAALGVASSGLVVLPSAIIRDRFSGDRMARMQSMVAMVFMVVPMIAPAMGQAVLLVASWRWIFGVMGLLALMVAIWAWLRLPETLHPEYRQSLAPAKVIRAMGTIVTTRSAIGYVLGLALIQAAMFGYINSSQQLLGEHFGTGANFPIYFGAMALIMSCTSFINSRIVVRFGTRRVSHIALFFYIAASLIQIVLAFSGHETLWAFVPVMTLNMCLMGFIGSNFGSMALQPFAANAGSAASAQAFIRMVTASVLGALIGQAYDGTARPLAIALTIAGTTTLGLVLFTERGRLFGRNAAEE